MKYVSLILIIGLMGCDAPDTSTVPTSSTSDSSSVASSTSPTPTATSTAASPTVVVVGSSSSSSSGGTVAPVVTTSSTGSTTSTTPTPTPSSSPIPPHFLYGASGNANNIYEFQINPTSGNLTELDPMTVSIDSISPFIKIDPSGKYLYAVNRTTQSLNQFQINSTTGVLHYNQTVSNLAQSLYPVTIGFSSNGSVFVQNLEWDIYTSQYKLFDLGQFAMANDGSLSWVSWQALGVAASVDFSITTTASLDSLNYKANQIIHKLEVYSGTTLIKTFDYNFTSIQIK